MASWQLLDEKEENELHKSRLLNVEEKPFKRITKRLTTLNSIRASQARQAPTPPPESTTTDKAAANGTADQDTAAAAAGGSSSASDLALELSQMKEDLTLDFAAFDSSIVRLQFLLSANARERERYAADRLRIVATSQAVRADTARLRARLDGARATLDQRRRFDELADKITSNRLLRPRADQQANLAKLEEECAALEAESETYAATWQERREQFSRIMDESMRLRRLIRDEKEEVERREGMDDEGGAEGGGGDGDGDGAQTPRPGLASGNATPRPDSGVAGATVKGNSVLSSVEAADGSGTPRPTSRGSGRLESPGPAEEEGGGGLKPPSSPSGSRSRNGSRGLSRDVSPGRAERGTRQGGEEEEARDVEMQDAPRPAGSPTGENTQSDGTPRITIESQDTGAEGMDTT